VGSPLFYRLQNAFLAGRTLVKLALLLEHLQRYGVNAGEVTALLNSELGMNDLTGEPWNITSETGKYVVHLTERTTFEIRPVGYTAEHAALIAEWQRIAAAIGAADEPRQEYPLNN
jgi:hypothetical protein